MSIAVQTAVGDIGGKATTELSYSFNSLLNCGEFQYGLNSSGIHLLNQGNLDNTTQFESSVTLQTSDYGRRNFKRFRFIYLEVEVYEKTVFTVSVRPNKGDWIDKTVTVKNAGLRLLRFSIKKKGGQGNYHAVKIASKKQFRIHSVFGEMRVRPLGVKAIRR
jgi:hypothetical protein